VDVFYWVCGFLLISFDFATKVGGSKVRKNEPWYNISSRCCAQRNVLNFWFNELCRINELILASTYGTGRDNNHKHINCWSGESSFLLKHYWNLQMDMTLLLPGLGQAGSFGYSVLIAKDPANQSGRAGEGSGFQGRKPCVWCRRVVGIMRQEKAPPHHPKYLSSLAARSSTMPNKPW